MTILTHGDGAGGADFTRQTVFVSALLLAFCDISVIKSSESYDQRRN